MEIKKVIQIATDARKTVLDMIYRAQTSHIGSNFSVIDILTVLYEKANITPGNWEDRDRIILSKGWGAASLYFFLNRKGLITNEDLASYCIGDSKFIGLAEPIVPGIEFAGGSMGHGLPAGVGMALAAKKQKKDYKVYVVMSDGEMDCGTTWESAMIAAHHKLDNLIVIVDCNKWQAMGRTDDVLDLGDLEKKWRAFGWYAETIDGHDHQAIGKFLEDSEKTLDQLHPNDIVTSWFSMATKPKVLIANTIKGKGVSIFEDKLIWHYKNIDDESYRKALNELS